MFTASESQDAGWFQDDDIMLLVQSNPLRTLRTRPHILQSDSTRHSRFQLVGIVCDIPDQFFTSPLQAEIISDSGNYIDSGMSATLC